MEGDRHRGCSDPRAPKLIEALEKGVQPFLLLCGSAPPPFCRALEHHLPGVLQEKTMVIPEVEPSVLPPPVRRRHDAPEVYAGARLPELERAAAGPQGPLLPALVAGRHLRLE